MRGRPTNSLSDYQLRLNHKSGNTTLLLDWVSTRDTKSTDKVYLGCTIHGDSREWGSPWITTVHSVLRQGRRCPKCVNKYKATESERIDQINSQRTTRFVSWVGEFKGSQSRANLSCTTCSHTWDAKIDKITTGLRGCPSCGHAGGYRHSTFDRRPELIDKPCDLYYIKFSKEGELDYYKIGLDTTGRRWGSMYYGWDVEEIWRKELTLRNAFEEEQLILEKNAQHKGYPEDFFKKPGYTEMFKEDIYG